MDILKKPLVTAVIGLIVGIVLGAVYAYNIAPTKWIDQPMTWTTKQLQGEFLRMSIDSYYVNRDGEMAGYRYYQLLGAPADARLADIKATPDLEGIKPKVLEAYENAIAASSYSPQNGGVVSPPVDNGGGGGNSLLIIVIILVSLILIGAVVYFIVIPLFRSNKRAPEDMTPAMLAAEHSRTMEKTDYSTVSSTPPVAQYVTTYVLGDDLFDDSFSIDAPSGEFLGECGVGISETVGGGDPKKVTAFEVWMFDKNDIQTITKVLMSANAFADLALRSKLEPKGELVQVEPRKQVLLETQTLQMIATISDMQYGQSALPNGSYFDRVTMELAIWQKAK
jgi:hypothetical protein